MERRRVDLDVETAGAEARHLQVTAGIRSEDPLECIDEAGPTGLGADVPEDPLEEVRGVLGILHDPLIGIRM
jgi:hypothetical protein